MPVIWALAGVYALLLFSSLLVKVLRHRTGSDYRELGDRIRSWWVMVVIFTLAIAVSLTISIIFLAFISFLAFKKFLSMIPTRRVDRRVIFWAFVAIPVQFYWVAIGWYGMFIIFIPVFMFLIIPARMVLAGETDGFLKAAGTLHWGLMTTVFSLSHAAFLLVLPAEKNLAGGAGLLFFLIFLTQFNDVAQYTWGKLFGKNPVVPKVSPKKTKEGLLGGVLTAVLAAWLIAPYLTPFSYQEALAAGLLIGLGGFLGDVVISAIKRDIGVKDSGNLIPGHGGIMDRVDSLTFTSPLFFHYLHYLHY
ncbi:MAG: phosphatidate cytidylyltransferase [Candidatus Thiodiazotropha sp. (ex Ustalcina ferruginea)]|nr:phosphatidate cytidylyltransferase [Candidatus Thiodiazotropha sp. (ex Ustalcina ferruginea)]